MTQLTKSPRRQESHTPHCPPRKADADPVADLPHLHAVADRVDHADQFVAGTIGCRVFPQALDGQHVGVTDAVGLHPDPHLAGRRRHQLALHQPEVPHPGHLERRYVVTTSSLH
ncbi:hypothetical protein GCM10018954_082700 [Kutzneria kofuensis]